jgi:alpha-galactosidase
VLAVNQESENNHQVYNRNRKICWLADVPDTRNKYLALFNLADEKQKITFEFEREYLRDSYMVRDLWDREDLGIFQKEFDTELEPHGAGLYKLIREYVQNN